MAQLILVIPSQPYVLPIAPGNPVPPPVHSGEASIPMAIPEPTSAMSFIVLASLLAIWVRKRVQG